MVGLIDSAEIEFGTDRKSCDEGSEQSSHVSRHTLEESLRLQYGDCVVRSRESN